MAYQNDLFRKEAIAYRLNRKRSENQLPMSSKFGWILRSLVGLSILLFLLMVTVKYRETESARGRLIANEAEQQLVAPTAGILDQILVSSGDKVSAGQIVAMVSIGLYGPEGQLLVLGERKFIEEKLQGLREQRQLLEERHRIQVRNLQTRIGEQIGYIELARSQRDSLNNQLLISQELLAATQSLLQSDSISEAHYKQQELEHLHLVQNLTSAEEKLQSSNAKLAELRNQIDADKVEQALSDSQLDQNITSLAQQLDMNHKSQHVSVVAARDGYVSTIALEEGQAVSSGQTILYLQANQQSLLAEVFVPSSIVARLYEGQQTLLRYDAFDFHTYGRYAATIEHIGRSALDPREHLLPFPDRGEPMFPVRVKPQLHYVEGSDVFPLQAGLLLEADFVMAEMSLVQFIFKPVMNLRGKVL